MLMRLFLVLFMVGGIAFAQEEVNIVESSYVLTELETLRIENKILKRDELVRQANVIDLEINAEIEKAAKERGIELVNYDLTVDVNGELAFVKKEVNEDGN